MGGGRRRKEDASVMVVSLDGVANNAAVAGGWRRRMTRASGVAGECSRRRTPFRPEMKWIPICLERGVG